MIADSPYEARRSPLPAWAGAVGGALGALLMLRILNSAPGSAAGDAYLTQLGAVVFNLPLGGSLALHVLIGATLGALFASSQRPVPVPDLIAVGLFYGMFLWVVGGVLGGAVLGGGVRGVLRTWSWLAACLSYGSMLAATAIMWQAIRPDRTSAVPRD